MNELEQPQALHAWSFWGGEFQSSSEYCLGLVDILNQQI